MNGDKSQGGDSVISNALVEDNVIYGNGAGGGSGINMDGVSDSTVRNNLIYDEHASGISLYRIDGATGSRNNQVVNNTIVNDSDGRWCVNINTGSTGNQVFNNILYNYHSFHGAITIDSSSRSGFASDYNAVVDRFSTDAGNSDITLADWQALGYDAHSFLATPQALFVNPGVDFHLLASSPAIDTGTATDAPTNDLDGNPRPIGAGVDIGAYEAPLPTCGNGVADPNEQCGEPSLPPCSDPCRSCQQCTCGLNPTVCGDGLVCGSEQCEADNDCAAGQTCVGCQCINPAICNSGITLTSAHLRVRATTFVLHLSAEALIPKPWTGVNPRMNGVRFVVDSPTGAGDIDLTIPGGSLWSVNTAQTRWVYRDPSGSAGGVTHVVIKDLSNRQDGLIKFTVTAKSATAVLPNVGAVRTSAVLGDTAECAALQWSAPSETRPRCDGDASSIRCH
jgi:hypothetical protein